MTKLDVVIPAFNYKISGGSEFQWNCYGPNARYLDFEIDDRAEINGCAIFDTKTQQVYELQLWINTEEDKAFQWIDKKYIAKYVAECREKGIEPDKPLGDNDDFTYDNIPTPKKMLNIINGYFSGAKK